MIVAEWLGRSAVLILDPVNLAVLCGIAWMAWRGNVPFWQAVLLSVASAVAVLTIVYADASRAGMSLSAISVVSRLTAHVVSASIVFALVRALRPKARDVLR